MNMGISHVTGDGNSNSFLTQTNTGMRSGTNRVGGSGNKTGDGTGMSLRRMESEMRMKQKANAGIVGQTLGYADSLKTARTKEKETSLQMKKLRYSFKSLSSQILRSKTSSSARQAAGKARREVIRLKRQRQSGEYDEEELQAAITHAQAMERAAKKKMRHLQEEELVKVTDDAVSSSKVLEVKGEIPQDETQAQDEALEETGEELQAAEEDALREQMETMQEQMQYMAEQMQDQMQREMEAAMEDMMAQMMEKMQDAMEEMMEDLDLMDMATDLYAPAQEMTEDDFKMLKLKHRTEEMKALTKADSEYLKSMFDRFEKMKNAGTPISGGGLGTAIGTGQSMGVTVGMPHIDMVSADVAVSGMAAGMPADAVGISIDVSV